MANARVAIVVRQTGSLDRTPERRRERWPSQIKGKSAGKMSPMHLRSEDQMSNDNVQLEGPDLRAGVELDRPFGRGDADRPCRRRGRDARSAWRGSVRSWRNLHSLRRPASPRVCHVGETIRCPWHHACFDLRTGEAASRSGARSTSTLACRGAATASHFVREKLARQPPAILRSNSLPHSILIVGGGAAGNAAAETLRREGYAGPITMLSADSALPCDRPNLSKDYLAGKAPEEWTVLRSADFYQSNGIDVRLNARVTRIDTELREVRARRRHASRVTAHLLLATGAEPVRLNIPGADRAHVHYLRTLEDSRALVAKAKAARSAVIIGASFIGLEVASSLRARGIEVHVVGPEAIPMARILGEELGSFIRSVHEQHGVIFHLGRGRGCDRRARP